jgi:hypothetical protein
MSSPKFDSFGHFARVIELLTPKKKLRYCISKSTLHALPDTWRRTAVTFFPNGVGFQGFLLIPWIHRNTPVRKSFGQEFFPHLPGITLTTRNLTSIRPNGQKIVVIGPLIVVLLLIAPVSPFLDCAVLEGSGDPRIKGFYYERSQAFLLFVSLLLPPIHITI